MKFKTVCASIAVATTMATGMLFVPQNHALAQNSKTQTEQANSRGSRSLEIQWILGIIPWPTWTRNPNIRTSQNAGNNPTYANNPNNPRRTNIGSANRPQPIGTTKQGQNHKQVPVPVLIPGMVALGAGLIRKHRQEQEEIEIK